MRVVANPRYGEGENIGLTERSDRECQMFTGYPNSLKTEFQRFIGSQFPEGIKLAQ